MILHDIVSILKLVDDSEMFIGTLPEQPDYACVVYPCGGEGSIRTLDGGVIERPQFKVVVRDSSAERAMSRATKITQVLDGYCKNSITNITVNSGFTSDGRDIRGRSLLSALFFAHYERS